MSLLLLLGLTFSTLQAQDKEKEDSKVTEAKLADESRDGLFNSTNTNVNGALINGGAYYVSNPSPTYKVDAELAYFNPEWQVTTVGLVDGTFYDVKGRYRVIDQAFEVLHKGAAYELRQDQLQSVSTPNERFLLMSDPMMKKRGAVIYQLYYNSNDYQLIKHHSAQWQDPPEQNMFDTREQHRTIKRKAELLLRVNGEFHQIKNNKDAFRILSIPKKGETAGFIRKNKLKLSNADDLVRVLEFLEN